MSEQTEEPKQSLGEEFISEQSQPQPDSGAKKLSAAERLSKWEALRTLHLEKMSFHRNKAAHYGKKIGALKRMAEELGVQII